MGWNMKLSHLAEPGNSKAERGAAGQVLRQGWDRNKTKTTPAQLAWSCSPAQNIKDVDHPIQPQFMDPDKELIQDQVRMLQLWNSDKSCCP